MSFKDELTLFGLTEYQQNKIDGILSNLSNGKVIFVYTLQKESGVRKEVAESILDYLAVKKVIAKQNVMFCTKCKKILWKVDKKKNTNQECTCGNPFSVSTVYIWIANGEKL